MLLLEDSTVARQGQESEFLYMINLGLRQKSQEAS